MCGSTLRGRLDTEISAKKLLQESYPRIWHTSRVLAYICGLAR